MMADATSSPWRLAGAAVGAFMVRHWHLTCFVVVTAINGFAASETLGLIAFLLGCMALLNVVALPLWRLVSAIEATPVVRVDIRDGKDTP